MSSKVIRGTVGDFYKPNATVLYQKDELWRAVKILLEELTGEKFTIAEMRKTWLMYCKSNFIKSMSFGEFVMKMHWGESVDG